MNTQKDPVENDSNKLVDSGEIIWDHLAPIEFEGFNSYEKWKENSRK